MDRNNMPFEKVGDLKILDLENYCTFFFVVIANRLSRGASAQYRREYGIGVVEWRCLVSLARDKSVTAAQISQTSSMNKSLVSRALSKLESGGYIENCSSSAKRKPRLLRMTSSGNALYAKALEDTLKREEALRSGLSKAEISELLRMLRLLLENAGKLDSKSGLDLSDGALN